MEHFHYAILALFALALLRRGRHEARAAGTEAARAS